VSDARLCLYPTFFWSLAMGTWAGCALLLHQRRRWSETVGASSAWLQRRPHNSPWACPAFASWRRMFPGCGRPGHRTPLILSTSEVPVCTTPSASACVSRCPVFLLPLKLMDELVYIYGAIRDDSTVTSVRMIEIYNFFM
jgi:hypothetical protein